MGERHHLLQLVLLTSLAVVLMIRQSEASLAPALFILGDSTVDTGNQDYITSVIKSNYPPYGIDFVPPGPTGRFSNGKLANDFIAEYLGLPFPVNFLAPEAKGSALLTGVNLASSGSGYLDITGQLFGVLNLTKQLENLQITKNNIAAQIGGGASEQLFSDAIYLISTGSNDFVNNYNLNPAVQKQYTPEQWKELVVASITGNLETVYSFGARKVVIDSLSPIGCVPEQLNLYGSKDGLCMENINAPLRNFNQALQVSLGNLRSQYPDYKLIYVNVYDLILDLIENPVANGYKFGNTACCGEGPYKGLPCVDPVSDVCDNPDDYVFWDLFHPSQKTYNLLAKTIIYGGQSRVTPYNLQQIVST